MSFWAVEPNFGGSKFLLDFAKKAVAICSTTLQNDKSSISGQHPQFKLTLPLKPCYETWSKYA